MYLLPDNLPVGLAMGPNVPHEGVIDVSYNSPAFDLPLCFSFTLREIIHQHNEERLKDVGNIVAGYYCRDRLNDIESINTVVEWMRPATKQTRVTVKITYKAPANFIS